MIASVRDPMCKERLIQRINEPVSAINLLEADASGPNLISMRKLVGDTKKDKDRYMKEAASEL